MSSAQVEREEQKTRRIFQETAIRHIEEWCEKIGSSFTAAFDIETEDEHFIRSYASVLVDDSVPQVENVKSTSKPLVINTSRLKGKSWADDSDTDSDEE